VVRERVASGNREMGTKSRATLLIINCMKREGVAVPDGLIDSSLLELELGEIKNDQPNASLFRFLNEAIWFLHLFDLCIMGQRLQNNKETLSVPKIDAAAPLVSSMLSTATAIRVLQNGGLDGPARQNLRALHEQALCLHIVLQDRQFSEAFLGSFGLRESNKFWHKFISKNKVQKSLRTLEAEGGLKCFLLKREHSDQFFSILGVAAHANHTNSYFDLERRWRVAGEKKPAGWTKWFHRVYPLWCGRDAIADLGCVRWRNFKICID